MAPLDSTADRVAPSLRRTPHRLTFGAAQSAGEGAGTGVPRARDLPPAAGLPDSDAGLQGQAPQRRFGAKVALRVRPWLSFAASVAVAATGLAALLRLPGPQPAATAAPATGVTGDVERAVAVLQAAGSAPQVADAAAPLRPELPEPGLQGREPGEAAQAQSSGPAASAAAAGEGLAPAARDEKGPVPPAARGAGISGAAASRAAGPAFSDRSPHVHVRSRSVSSLASVQYRECGHMGLVPRGFCEQHVRLSYCAGRYGRAQDCPIPQILTPN